MDKDLSQYTAEELTEELTRRAKQFPRRPNLVDDEEMIGLYLENLQRATEAYLDKLEAGEFVDSDDKHYIFEAAMEAMYGGKTVWDYINAKQK